MKGLPLAYNKDLQEDKRAAFDQVDDLLGALAALAGVRCAGCASTPRGWRRRPAMVTVATDVAEHLVREGMPFREAHHPGGGAASRRGERFSDAAAEQAAGARQSPQALHDQLDRLTTALA